MTGPSLESLLHHLVECPEIFLERPLIVPSPSQKKIHSLAVVQDLFLLQDVTLPVEVKDKLPHIWRYREISHWLGLQLLAYLYSHPWFYGRPELARGFSRGMEHMRELAKVVSPSDFISNPVRREELCRLALSWCGFDPSGESPEQAEDRLKALDSLYRLKLEEKSREARDRSSEIRRKILEARAREAANPYGRE